LFEKLVKSKHSIFSGLQRPNLKPHSVAAARLEVHHVVLFCAKMQKKLHYSEICQPLELLRKETFFCQTEAMTIILSSADLRRAAALPPPAACLYE